MISIWLMIGLAGLTTFGALPERWQLPPRAQAVLGYVPVTVFAALAVPGLRAGTAAPALSASRVLASVVSAYVAWQTRHLLLALLVGIGVFWLDLWVS